MDMFTNMMNAARNVTHANQVGEMNKALEYDAARKAQVFHQTKELEKQTSILSEAKQLTLQNAEYTKQIAEYTQRNEESSKRNFKASIAFSATAALIAFISLGVAIAQLLKP